MLDHNRERVHLGDPRDLDPHHRYAPQTSRGQSVESLEADHARRLVGVDAMTPEAVARIAELVSVLGAHLEAERASALHWDAKVAPFTANANPIDVGPETARDFDQAAMIDNYLPVPILAGFDQPATLTGNVFTIPPLCGRVIPRPHSRLSLGCDPAYLPSLTTLPIGAGVYVARFRRYMGPSTYSLMSAVGSQPASNTAQAVTSAALVPLAALVPGRAIAVYLRAAKANTDVIYLGDSTLTNTGGGKVFTQLDANQGVALSAASVAGLQAIAASVTQTLYVGVVLG